MDSQVVKIDVADARTDDSAMVKVDGLPAQRTERDTTTDHVEGCKKAVQSKLVKKGAKSTNPKKHAKSMHEADSSDTDSDDDNDDDESSSSDSDSSTDPDSSDADSESEGKQKKKKKQRSKKQKAEKAKRKSAKAKKSKQPVRIPESSDASSDSDSDSDSGVSDADSSDSSSSGAGHRKGKGAASKKARKNRHLHSQTDQQQQDLTRLLLLQQQQQQHEQQQQQQQQQQFGAPLYYGSPLGDSLGNPLSSLGTSFPRPPHPVQPFNSLDRILARRRSPPGLINNLSRGQLGGLNDDVLGKQKHGKSSKHRRSKAPRLDYKRVDRVWDSTIHNYKLQDTAEGATNAEYEGYLFHVRRTFDWEGKYEHTVVDIKSKLLRDALQEVIGEIKGVSFVEETPKVDPNLLFLYLDEIRQHIKELKKAKPTGNKKTVKKERKNNEKKRRQLKVLVKYLKKDYETVKKSLRPLLENGLITFDFLWALWKPNTLAYTTTYGSSEEARVFKVEVADKHFSIMKGNFYFIEGKYFEYDGKRFGFGNLADEISEFRGTRRITSLPVYPLKYHKNEAALRENLIARGKKFVALSGVQYKSYEGMAYYKKKKAVVRVNITGRIMIDPSIHRRTNPNYPVSIVRANENGLLPGMGDSDSELGGGFGCDSDLDSDSDMPRVRLVALQEGKGSDASSSSENEDSKETRAEVRVGSKVQSPDSGSSVNEDTESGSGNTDGHEKDKIPEFGDEEYLIASPVVLGFAFAEKLWLEFTVSNVKEIQWNETAYESLVLEPKTKDIVKALVESHKYHAAESIDDVIQGKGKGLVAVLHGPPGTGKTLTAEGISELLKCPLYMVSAGELGTDSRFLESELQKILDICHAWGAILLLDEADVFLEKRNMHDIHRNALVSIFLRQLEYFQGILFLTTNRVETFDDAFQSRIHIALRYDSLDTRAKKAIFKIFIERVRVLEKVDLMPFTEEDFNVLARHELNGRQIKNTVRTAQALAVNKREPLSMGHIRQVLEVQMSFDRDLKGGPGFQDAMRSYF